MTDLRKAAEMALEALENLNNSIVLSNGEEDVIKALRQALAMERFSEVSQAIEEALKQEPVAWLYQTAYGDKFIHKKEQAAFHQPGGTFAPLYTAPPKREWVGLTDNETDGLIYSATYMDETDLWHLVSLVEERLKEKNNA